MQNDKQQQQKLWINPLVGSTSAISNRVECEREKERAAVAAKKGGR